MKITFLVSGSIRSNFVYRSLAFARALTKQGYQVSIIAPKADKYNSFKAENVKSIDGIRILQPFQFATKRPEINLLPYLFGAAKVAIRSNADLFYIYKPTPVNIIGFIIKLFRQTPIVVDMDDLGSEVMKIEGHPWHQRKLVEWSERFAVKHADRLVVASTYLFDKFRKEFPDKPIWLMPNAAEADWFTPPILSKEKERIVFMGSINRKNILEPLFEVLPEIIKARPDVNVLIVGDGKDAGYFRKKSEEAGLSSHITFTGWLDIAEARSRLCMGDIGYNYMPDEPTIKAANNMKVSQYMARGVVPLVSHIGDLPGMVDFGKAGYICEAGNSHALKTILLQALEDKNRMQKAEYARNFALETFNWDRLAIGFYDWLFPRRTGQNKKIYLVASGLPGNSGGGDIRNYNLIKQLLKQPGADIDLFCATSGEPEIMRDRVESEVHVRCHLVRTRSRNMNTILRAFFLARVSPFMYELKASGIGDVFRSACENSLPDVVQIEQMQTYYALRPHISWLKSRGVKIVLDCHNIEFRSFGEWLAILPWPQKIAGKFLAPHLKEIEIEAVKQSDMVFACSESDANFFKEHNANTYVIPNGVDGNEFQLVKNKQNTSPTILFMGGVLYPPNADAIRFYLSDIHPKIKEGLPDVVLLAIGADPNWLAASGIDDLSVKPLGFVEDVRPYLDRAIVGICPVRYGSGTRIKIMTYMAAGLPVVSTAKGAEGVTYTNGHDIIITDDPVEFANAILKLFNDRVYREEIARNGREFILKNYDWNVIGKKLAHTYEHHLR